MHVKIDYQILAGAISGLDTLSSAISSQSSRAEANTPIALPTLSPLKATVTWIDDQKPLLSGLHDIAQLLADKGSTVSSFDVNNNVKDVKTMLGQTLADKGQEIRPPADDDESKAYLAMLKKWNHDPATMAAMQLKLGPEGSLRLLNQWAAPAPDAPLGELSDGQRDLVAAMKTSLESATQKGGFTETENTAFANGLVHEATRDPEDLARHNPYYNPSGALAYLLRDGHYGDTFIGTTMDGLDQYERQDHEGASKLWGGRPDNGVDFSGYMPYGDAATYDNLDPMASGMSAMANNPHVALDFFSNPDGDPPRAEYYIKERNWDQDCFDGISAALDSASTDPSILDGTPEEQHQAAVLASESVNYFSEREYVDDVPGMLNRWPENGAAEDLAHIMGTYMNGVSQGIDNKGADIGAYGNIPAFDKESLEKFGLAAMSTDQGLAEVTNGMNNYRALHLGSLADNLAAHDTDDNRTLLRGGIQDDARLQGFFLHTQGEDKIHDAAERDARTRAMIGHLTDVVDLVPVPGVSKLDGVVKDAANLTINTVKGEAYGSFEDSIAHEESDTRSHYESTADEVNRREQFSMAQFLDDRDLSAHPDKLNLSHPNGSMLSYDEYAKLPTSQQDAVERELFGENGVGGVYNRQDYSEAFKSEFGKYYG